ncbi:hypothetical protein DYD21_14245 [Rhodohalobacter sp. SW132]|nr:hypothetical protein [Rhodohalobacter sp. SW132]REL32972.1 hypothetical protein DYD21_14245 [Rhodohalobacter sp. SW132]
MTCGTESIPDEEDQTLEEVTTNFLTIGGSGGDYGQSIYQTGDGGFIVSGLTTSTDGIFSESFAEGRSIFVIKFNIVGDKQWVKTFNGHEGATSIVQSHDGGYILTGHSRSIDGNYSNADPGLKNLYIIKLNSLGEIQWEKKIGGSDNDEVSSIAQLHNGSIVLTGGTSSNDGDFSGMNSEQRGIFVIKLDSDGNTQLIKIISGNNWSSSVINTHDGGFALTGHAGSNIIIIKFNSDGKKQWTKTYGGTEWDMGNSIIQAKDGGFILTGGFTSNDGDFHEVNKGGWNIPVIKLDSLGEIEWVKTFGGSGYQELGHSISLTQDGGFILTGETSSNDGDFMGLNQGETDIFVIKLKSSGDTQWVKTFGGSGFDNGYSVTQIEDGDYVVTGRTSSNDGDFSSNKNQGDTIFLIKLDSEGKTIPFQLN